MSYLNTPDSCLPKTLLHTATQRDFGSAQAIFSWVEYRVSSSTQSGEQETMAFPVVRLPNDQGGFVCFWARYIAAKRAGMDVPPPWEPPSWAPPMYGSIMELAPLGNGNVENPHEVLLSAYGKISRWRGRPGDWMGTGHLPMPRQSGVGGQEEQPSFALPPQQLTRAHDRVHAMENRESREDWRELQRGVKRGNAWMEGLPKWDGRKADWEDCRYWEIALKSTPSAERSKQGGKIKDEFQSKRVKRERFDEEKLTPPELRRRMWKERWRKFESYEREHDETAEEDRSDLKHALRFMEIMKKAERCVKQRKEIIDRAISMDVAEEEELGLMD